MSDSTLTAADWLRAAEQWDDAGYLNEATACRHKAEQCEIELREMAA